MCKDRDDAQVHSMGSLVSSNQDLTLSFPMAQSSLFCHCELHTQTLTYTQCVCMKIYVYTCILHFTPSVFENINISVILSVEI